MFAKKPIQAGNGAGISPHTQLDPEYHQSGIGVPAPHVLNQSDLVLPMLIRVIVRPMRAILEARQRAVVAFAPPVDILPVGAIADCCFCHAMFVGIFD